jgi:hypothetical protein
MIAIFATIDSALAFDAAVSLAMGWPNTETKTDRYCEPQKHITEDLWAMPVEPYAVALVPSDAVVVDSLTADWNAPRP